MEIWITAKNVAGTIVGSGPITTATNWTQAKCVDKPGAFSFDMPASDVKWQSIVSGGTCECYGLLNGTVTLLGTGLVEQIEEVAGDPSIIRVSGYDLLRELARYPVGDLKIAGHSVKYISTNGAVRWIDSSGISAEVDLTQAYDGDTGTDTAAFNLGDHWWLYIGFDMPFRSAKFTFHAYGASNNGDCQYQYYSDETGWTDFSDLVDGTIDGTGYEFRQNGTISWTQPTDWARSTPTESSGEWFWARIRADKLATGAPMNSVELDEIEVDADEPTDTGVALITAVADSYSAWSTVSTATTVEVFMQFSGESVLAALQALAKATGDHFILGTGRTITWLGPASGWSDCGYRSVGYLSGAGAESATEAVLITGLTRLKDTAELVTRLIPFSGVGGGRISIAASTDTYAGYTISKTPTAPAHPYIENDSAYSTYGVIAKTMSFDNIELQEAASETLTPEYAANTLLSAAQKYLATHCIPAYSYSVGITGFKALILPAKKAHIVYQEWTDGVKTLDINTYPSSPLYLMGITYRVGSDGALTARMEVSNVERERETGDNAVVGAIRQVNQIARSTGASSSTTTINAGTTSGLYVTLPARLASTSWDGDAKSSADNGIIDLSAVFGAPAGIKAVDIRLAIKAGAAGNYGAVGPDSTYYYRLAPVIDETTYYKEANGLVPCDANGDIYFKTDATVGTEINVVIQIWGYVS